MKTDPADEIDNPSPLERIRRHNRRVGRHLYRQWRIGLTIGAPLFVLGGLRELAGLANPAGGHATRLGAGAVLIVLGAAMAMARMTWFREPPHNGSAA